MLENSIKKKGVEIAGKVRLIASFGFLEHEGTGRSPPKTTKAASTGEQRGEEGWEEARVRRAIDAQTPSRRLLKRNAGVGAEPEHHKRRRGCAGKGSQPC